MKHQLDKFDTSTTKWVVSVFGARSRPFFELMTALGDPLSIFLIASSIIVTGWVQNDYRLAASGVMIPLTILVGAILKILFERARPLTDYAMQMKIKTFSFPSGHSSGSMVTFGLLSYIAFLHLNSPLGLITGSILAAIPFFVGLSRVYLGAHFPTDVLAGWLLGALGLITIIAIIRPFA